MSESIIPYALPTPRQQRQPEYFQLRCAIMQVADKGLPFSSDEVQQKLADAGERIVKVNCFGSAFYSLAKQGYIRKAGYRESTREKRHAGLLRVWISTGKEFNFKAEERAVELLSQRPGELPLIF